MSLISCPDCENAVSSTAASCPVCGRPIAKKSRQISMVDLLVYVVAIGLFLWALSETMLTTMPTK